MKAKDISSGLMVSRLRALLSYDPETGVFKWKARSSPQSQIVIGAVAGYKHHTGYLSIKIDGRDFLGHRLAWLYSYSEWPEDQVDHKNTNRSDNRLDNLRASTHGQNRANSNGGLGVAQLKGASISHRKGHVMWRGQFIRNGKRQHLGYFETADEAHNAYRQSAQRHDGEFARF